MSCRNLQAFGGSLTLYSGQDGNLEHMHMRMRRHGIDGFASIREQSSRYRLLEHHGKTLHLAYRHWLVPLCDVTLGVRFGLAAMLDSGVHKKY
jgi:hypothetical protein